ncbi:MAG: acyl-CoA dehydrogenase [Acidobacteria bacterium]|jgi:alkylation response protein AidB-like acyl-CoA dehydrogenase|nr:acyl-CoA dehydrogenase [Acidobacteriota bacterium]
MDYLLTEEQKMMKDMVSKFAREEIGPVARENQEKGIFPAEIIQKAGELGLMGVAYPPEYGGAGMDYISYMIAVEEVSRYCASTGVIISAHSSLAIDPIYRFGTEAQKKKYMPDLCSGKNIGCFALTEPGAGSDAGSTKTTARLDGDKWILNGTKHFITNGAEAEIAVVFASTDLAQKTKGISAFIVEKGTHHFKVGKHEKKLGINSTSTTELIFEDCVIPKENLLGELNKGFKVAMTTLDGGRLGICAQALGIARASIEDAVKYAKEREQFGQPIANFQAIQWMIADMCTEYEAAWLLGYRGSLMKDKGMSYSKEAAMAKLKASEVASFCAAKAIQIHGGYGYVKEFDVERYLRDAKITEIYEGTNEIMRMVISATALK